MEKEELKNEKLKIIRDGLKHIITIPSISSLTKIKYNGNFNELDKLSKKGGLYFLFDEYNKLLYVRKSLNIGHRVKIHLSENTSCRYDMETENTTTSDISSIPYGVVTQIRYLFLDKLNYSWLEKFYIITYKPYFNKHPEINLSLKEKWEQYNLFRDNKIKENINREVEEIKKNGKNNHKFIS